MGADLTALATITPALAALNKFFGLTADSRNPSPSPLPAVMVSLADIQPGSSGSSPSAAGSATADSQEQRLRR